jgi:hypothetical protein
VCTDIASRNHFFLLETILGTLWGLFVAPFGVLVGLILGRRFCYIFVSFLLGILVALGTEGRVGSKPSLRHPPQPPPLLEHTLLTCNSTNALAKAIRALSVILRT